MGWYETCKSEVASMRPPGSMCDYNRCMKIQQKIDNSCHSRHWEPGSPYVLDNPDGSVCYCCCSCFAHNTPIAVNGTDYKLVQDFRKNDKVFAADANLNWKEVTVDFCTNIEGAKTKAFMVNIRWGTQDYEQITVTEDHLFLIPGVPSRVLIPAGALNVNDHLIRPDGSTVKITQVVAGMQDGGVYQLATGEPKNTVDGHLLNSNGVISADFALQAGYIGGQLDKSLLVADIDKRLHVSSEAYSKKYNSKETLKFMASPDLWPKGFTITPKHNLYVVPSDAASFMTHAQAQDIMDNKEAPTRPFSNNYAIGMVEYLWVLFKGFYPDINYVMDWNNSLPNAYAFNSYSQQYILITGGLLRQSSLDKDGLSLIISQALAHLNVAESEGKPIVCTGVADYNSVEYLGNVFRDKTYIEVFRNGLGQVEQLWNYISDANRKGRDKCSDPAIDCRIETFKAASYMDPLPACADPDFVPFEVKKATSKKGDGTVEVTFSNHLNDNTALTLTNYEIVPYVEITDAKVSERDPKKIILSAVLFEKEDYALTISNVLSANGYELDPNPTTLPLKLE